MGILLRCSLHPITTKRDILAGIRVTVWNEHIAERENGDVRRIYPAGIHEEIASAIRELLGDRAEVRTATLEQPQHGLTDDVLERTDVLVWWGHLAHELVDDAVVANVQTRVLAGMGLVVLHSAHLSKPFVRLMGTGCNVRWREGDDRELVWTIHPSHPIVQGVPPVFAIPRQEMYSEFFDIPRPDDLVFISSFSGGEVFRSGCCFYRGQGRIFYFSPGHETRPVYRQPEVRQVIANGVLWAAPSSGPPIVLSSCVRSPVGWFEAGT
jgi:trehalose utilization protein